MNPFHLLCTDESSSRCAGQTPDKGKGLAGADHRPLRSAHPSWLLFFFKPVLLSVHVFSLLVERHSTCSSSRLDLGSSISTSTSSGV